MAPEACPGPSEDAISAKKAWPLVALLGLVAAVGWQATRRHVHCDWDLWPVVVAARDLPAGTVLDYEMLSQRLVLPHQLSDSDVRPDRAPEFLSRRILVSVMAGAVLRWDQLEPAGVPVPVPRHGRVFQVRKANPAGIIQPADRVDVLFTIRHEPSSGEAATSTLLQNVQVLTADLSGDVGLLLLPEEAELLLVAAESGSLRLSLRHPDSQDEIEPDGPVHVRELLTEEWRLPRRSCTDPWRRNPYYRPPPDFFSRYREVRRAGQPSPPPLPTPAPAAPASGPCACVADPLDLDPVSIRP
ncbi:MAG: Flp pilus assembly protein CpaB [Myxococcales bacterium]